MCITTRYLLIEEDRDGQMMPIIEPHTFASVFVCGLNGLALAVICFVLYTLSDYIYDTVKYLWNSLTAEHQLIEITIILLTIIGVIIIVSAFKGIIDILDGSITKLKNENKKKDEQIRELENQLSALGVKKKQ